MSERDLLLAFLAPDVAATRERAGKNFHRVELCLIDRGASLASVTRQLKCGDEQCTSSRRCTYFLHSKGMEKLPIWISTRIA